MVFKNFVEGGDESIQEGFFFESDGKAEGIEPGRGDGREIEAEAASDHEGDPSLCKGLADGALQIAVALDIDAEVLQVVFDDGQNRLLAILSVEFQLLGNAAIHVGCVGKDPGSPLFEFLRGSYKIMGEALPAYAIDISGTLRSKFFDK